MNLKKIGFKVAIAAATVAGVATTVSPAQAISFGSTVSFNLFDEVAGVSADGIDFIDIDSSITVNDGSGDFSPYIGTQATFADLSKTVLDSSPSGSYKFFTLSKTGFDTIDFFLTGIDVVESTDISFNANISGFFFNNGISDGTSADPATSYVAAFKFGAANDGDASVTAIPTPALLPGLIGMGVAVLRKRKRDAVEEAEA